MNDKNVPSSEVGAILEQNLTRWYALALRLVGDEALARSVVQYATSKGLATEVPSRDPNETAISIRNAIIAKSVAVAKSRSDYEAAPDSSQLPKYDRFGVLIEKPERELVPVTQLLQNPDVLSAANAAVTDLPGKLRILLVLYDIEDLDGAEVAELTGMSANAVKRELHTARLLLSSVLARFYGEEGK